jgi:hypothetical protein
MRGFSGLPIHIDRTELVIGLVLVTILGLLLLSKKRFAAKAETWPVTEARVENVFLDVSSRGPNRVEQTHTVLAYAYAIGDSYYSGQITLWAGQVSLESVEKEMVGRQISVHYNPEKPEISIFLKREVLGRLVVTDRRLSLWSWLG